MVNDTFSLVINHFCLRENSMNEEYKRGVVKPLECFSEGWQLIKDRYWLFFGITAIGFIIGSVIPLYIGLGAMMCGIYYPLREKYEGRNPEFAQLFKGFDKFVPSLMATLPWAIPLFFLIVAAYIPLIIAEPLLKSRTITEETFFTLLIACFGTLGITMLIWIFVHPFLMFVYQIIIDNEISGWQGLKLSFRSVWANLGGVVGLLVLNVLAYSVGILFCGIGAYFVLPLIFANTYVAYRKVFPKINAGRFAAPPPPNLYNL